MKKINNFTEAKGSLDVTLYNSINSENGFYGKVSRRTVDLENIIADIAKNNAGVTPLMVQHIASLLQAQILRLLGLGFSVNILELGTIYLAAEGTIKSMSLSDIPTLTARFTPSPLLREKAASVKVEHVLMGSGAPVIATIEDTFDTSENAKNFLTSGRVARITGRHVRLREKEKEEDQDVEERNGIFFVPLAEDGSLKNDESLWVKAQNVMKNTPTVLEFYVPEELDKEIRYRLAIRTDSMGKGKKRKEPATTFSDEVLSIH